MLAIRNGTVYTGRGVIPDGVVLVDGTKIRAVGRSDEIPLPEVAESLDAAGASIVPGFVDMHMHGLHGFSAMDGDVASIAEMSLRLARFGVTSFLPTTVSAPWPEITAAIASVRAAQHEPLPGAELLGVHVEGPYLSHQERGAHPEELLRVPADDDPECLLAHCDVVRLVTLAPELSGAVALIASLHERGVAVSAGHSVAVDSEFEPAVDAGLSHATHLFCNMGTLRRMNLRRVAGLVESILLDDRVTAEIIADGYHIAPSLMKLAFKIKGAGKLALVTDASALTGMPPGQYRHGGRDVVVEQHVTYVTDRSAYAGSVATMDHCLRHAIDAIGLALEDALPMATLTPATILGVDARKGSLETGKDADIVIMDRGLRVVRTIAAGRVVV